MGNHWAIELCILQVLMWMCSTLREQGFRHFGLHPPCTLHAHSYNSKGCSLLEMPFTRAHIHTRHLASSTSAFR